MNKWKGKWWLKAVVLVATVVTAFGMGLGATALIATMAISHDGEQKIKDETFFQSRMLDNYALAILNNADETTETEGNEDGETAWNSDGYEGSSLTYAVERIRFEVKKENGEPHINNKVETVYGDVESLRKNKDVHVFGTHGRLESYLYAVDSFREILTTDPMNHYYDDIDMVDYTWDGEEPQLLFDYYSDEEGYIPDETLSHVPEGTYDFYRVYLLVDQEKCQKYTRSVLGSNPQLSFMVKLLNDHLEDMKFDNGTSDYLWTGYAIVKILSVVEKMATPLFVICFILFVAAFCILMTMSGHREEDNEIHTRWVDRVPFLLVAGVAVVGVSLGIGGNIGLAYLFAKENMLLSEFIALSVLLVILWELLTFAFCMSVATRCKSGHFMKYTLVHYILKPICTGGKAIGEFYTKHTKVGVRLIIALVILAFLELMGLAATFGREEVYVVFFLYKVAETLFIFWFTNMLLKLHEGGKRVANGQYDEPIKTEKMLPVLKEHGENINHVGEGIAVAVEQQMKSERLKTELITNVSHDIKTPLTSIINYVDLLKKQEIQDPTAKEYLEVLDRQSARLKKLIEDLMDASKASTGNVEVTMETCDATVMISQIVGEYQEKLQARGVEVIVNGPEPPVSIKADGRHLWRVLDNLMSNVNKYAQDNTRVYVNIEVGLHQTKMTFKNTSKYPLNISSEELMERFVRGDSSRNAETEGHGLGLSIAQSLTELMGGKLELAIDGDLFKVTVTMKR